MGDDSKDALPDGKRLKGMRMRDEFICPITYQLLRDPVVASDGNTYEKSAIERWLKTTHTSPRTGDPMDATLIPNLNLKKLIQDILEEVRFPFPLVYCFKYFLFIFAHNIYIFYIFFFIGR
jgi:hypothetical protein